jgi:hypothetical protein
MLMPMIYKIIVLNLARVITKHISYQHEAGLQSSMDNKN